MRPYMANYARPQSNSGALQNARARPQASKISSSRGGSVCELHALLPASLLNSWYSLISMVGVGADLLLDVLQTK